MAACATALKPITQTRLNATSDRKEPLEVTTLALVQILIFERDRFLEHLRGVIMRRSPQPRWPASSSAGPAACRP